MLRHEIAKLQPHEFAMPTDERGCCAVCHEPVDFSPHQPFTLRELHRREEEASMIWLNKTSDDCIGIGVTINEDGVILRIGPEEQGKGRYAVLSAKMAKRVGYFLLATAEKID